MAREQVDQWVDDVGMQATNGIIETPEWAHQHLGQHFTLMLENYYVSMSRKNVMKN